MNMCIYVYIGTELEVQDWAKEILSDGSVFFQSSIRRSLGKLESENQRFELRIRLARAAGVPVLTVARTGGASQSEHDAWIEDTTVQYWSSN